jgi:phosphate transport system permease protein
VITAGGIGTIVAVLGVLVFLVAVTAPLFGSARITAERTLDLSPENGPKLVAVGCDETGLIAWTLFEDGRLQAFSTRDGSLLIDRPGTVTGLFGIRCVRRYGTDQSVVLAFGDGFALGQLGLKSSFVAGSDLPESLRQLRNNEAAVDGDSIVVHHGDGHFGRLQFRVDVADRRRVGSGGVKDVDATELASGPLVAALGDDGTVLVEAISQRRNFLTDELITEATGCTLEPDHDPEESPMRFIRVSELGDQLFLIHENGRGRRYEIRSVETPREVERFSLTDEDATVTAVARLFGGNTLAVGDDSGLVSNWFLSRTAPDAAVPEGDTVDGLRFRKSRVFPAQEGGLSGEVSITGLVGSPRSRIFAATAASGRLSLMHSTTGRVLASTAVEASVQSGTDGQRLVISERENVVLAASNTGLQRWSFAAGYPEVSLGSLFGTVWYESYPEPLYVWETTGHESFEPKYGLVPLVFGTIKATLYSMLFAVPVAILAAIYSSQFMKPEWKARVKPTIEMMASLPSVVLGFLAGLVFAPFLEQYLSSFLASCLTVPVALLTGAHLWQLMPAAARTINSRLRFPVILLLVIPTGLLAGRVLGPAAESMLFNGSFLAWLDGRGGNGSVGWMLATLPLAGIAVSIGFERMASPFLRERSAHWTPLQAGLVSLVTFILAVAAAIALAAAAGVLFDALRFDTRGGVFGTYVQRNAMVVGIGMSFAIIPLIFTIADDALSSVPEHLRSASLGAGATPWQTAIRVIVPAASGGIFSAVMIGLGRAVGETMIVLMAAGNTPLLKWNIFNGFQTLSAALATELPEAARGTAHYRVLFLAALTLFAMTFVVNTIAEIVRQRVRRRSYEL